jgi:hypothetical protein
MLAPPRTGATSFASAACSPPLVTASRIRWPTASVCSQMLNQRLSRRGPAPPHAWLSEVRRAPAVTLKTFSLPRSRLGGTTSVVQRSLRFGNFYTRRVERLVCSTARMAGAVGADVRSRPGRRRVPRCPCRTMLWWSHIATDACCRLTVCMVSLRV